MAATERDLELFAARIRPHFAPEYRDAAYELALGIARLVGARVKQLKPETTYADILGWMEAEASFGNSLDRVELVMAAEAEIGSAFELPDELAPHPERVTFRDLVVRHANPRD